MPNIETEITEETRVPLRIVAALLGCAATISMVAGGLVLWGARLEAKTEAKVDRLNYVQDISELKADVKSIKKHLKIQD